ncbi:sensor histidine kinase [Desulfatibacillum aliphaticivorans]|uniref:sensor histidine kinase n=1 Tax=Desulfatibacillum aliphaticivorans TaxID=218208 RepID=UPI00040B1836|nr:ATP-binding protein [Desulfatibacillum aliphaticivorans]
MKDPRLKSTIRRKVNGAILLTSLIAALIFVAVQIPMQQRRLNSTMGKVDTILRTLVERDREPLANEIFERSVRAIKIRTNEMSDIPGILDISVYDKRGRLLASDDLPLLSQLIPPARIVGPAHATDIRQMTFGGLKALQFTRTIDAVGEHIGYITIIYDLSEVLKEHKYYSLLSIAMMLSVLGCVGLFLNLLLSKGITQPITRLRDAMDNIRKGDLGGQVDVSELDEIGDLSLAFNEMSRDLEESYSRIQDQYRELQSNREKLNKTRIFLNSILDSMPSVLVGVDGGGFVNLWNKETESMSGIKASDAVGRRLENVLPQISGLVEDIKEALKKRKGQFSKRITFHWSGRMLTCDLIIYPIAMDGNESAVIRLDDVTRRVKIEEMMIQSEKMVSIGGLAAGMAHEINNPLAGIVQNIQVAQTRLNSEMSKNQAAAEESGITMAGLKKYLELREVNRILDLVRTSGIRAARVVSNMLSFSRKSTQEYSRHNVMELLDNMVELSASDFDLKTNYDFRKIRIIREYDLSTPEVLCEGNLIQQVFFNLLKNAAQALCETDVDDAGIKEIILRVRPEPGFARIEMQDNGPGMHEDIRKRIFEPFYTTKPPGAGTGLGLSVSYFIITDNHGGTMHVDTSLGQGARFVIRLPYEPMQPEPSENL